MGEGRDVLQVSLQVRLVVETQNIVSLRMGWTGDLEYCGRFVFFYPTTTLEKFCIFSPESSEKCIVATQNDTI